MRRSPMRRWLGHALGLAMLALAAAPAAGAATAHDARQRLHRLRRQIQSVEHDLAGARSKREHLQTDLRRAEQAIAAQVDALAALDRHIRAQHQRVAATEQRIGELAAQVQRQSELLARQMRSAFEMGRQPALRLLLSQRDPARAQRMMVYYRYLSRARSHQISQTEARLGRLQKLDHTLARQSARLAALKQQRSANLQTLKQARSVREAAVRHISHHIAGQHQRLAQLKRSAARLQQLMQKLTAAPPPAPPSAPPATPSRPASPPSGPIAGRPFGELRGHLPWPLRGKLLNGFGSPQERGAMPSKGIWIAAAQGTPVKAMAAGRVAFAGWLPRYGLIMIIQHAGGYYTLYGHDQVVFHKVGDSVRRGEVIARAGDTGGYQRSGLYLEIRKGTRALDPLRWLTRR